MGRRRICVLFESFRIVMVVLLYGVNLQTTVQREGTFFTFYIENGVNTNRLILLILITYMIQEKIHFSINLIQLINIVRVIYSLN